MKGMVSAGHELTASTGVEILKAGGNAFDAAVAACFTAFVCESVLTSPGGGGFFMARTSDGGTTLYDFFTEVPGRGAGLEKDGVNFHSVRIHFVDSWQELHIGQGSAAVPGCMAGLAEVHRRHCTMPLGDLLAQAVGHAKDGVRLSRYQADFNRILAPMLTVSEESRAVYAPGGRFLEEGDTIKNPAMADAFDYLAREGLERFYDGDIGKMVIEGFGRSGYITERDLLEYSVERRDPLAVAYRGNTIFTNPPPSAGGCLVAFALKLIEAYDLRPMGFGSRHALVLLGEVMRVVGEARREDFNRRIYEPGMATEFLSPERVALYGERLALLERGMEPASPEGMEAAAAGGPVETGSTTHISVMDGQGAAASVTTTTGIGCGHMIPGTGIMMNNMLGEEDVNPIGFHAQPPGVRMSSMMAPTVVARDGRPVIVTGTGGSKRIRDALLQVLVNLIDHGLDVDEAVNLPRVHLDDRGVMHVEEGFDAAALASLEGSGARLKRWDTRHMFFGGVHTVVASDGGFAGAGDRRRGGATYEWG